MFRGASRNSSTAGGLGVTGMSALVPAFAPSAIRTSSLDLMNGSFLLPGRLVAAVARFCDEDAVQNVIPHQRKSLYRVRSLRLNELKRRCDAFVESQPDRKTKDRPGSRHVLKAARHDCEYATRGPTVSPMSELDGNVLKAGWDAGQERGNALLRDRLRRSDTYKPETRGHPAHPGHCHGCHDAAAEGSPWCHLLLRPSKPARPVTA